jgi:hypothetical protein
MIFLFQSKRVFLDWKLQDVVLLIWIPTKSIDTVITKIEILDKVLTLPEVIPPQVQ